MIDRIKSLADEVFADVVAIRRDLHANPELSFNEHRTAAVVADKLRESGLDVETGVAGTGIVAHLKGGLEGRSVGLRADMDALPVQEETALEFASRTPGVMHACGHDVHTSSLLGTAMILARLRDDLHGSVRFLFQPGEEKLPGGAGQMIADGALDARNKTPAVELIIGQHVRPDLQCGTVGFRSGPFMASSDEVYVTVKGDGGHAAEPHRLSADAVYVASQIVVALQSVVSRHCPPDVPSVLTIGKVLADGATNVIPSTVHLMGTFRSMHSVWRKRGHELIERIVRHTAAAHGATADCVIDVGYPALVNDAQATEGVRDGAVEYLGRDNVRDVDMWFAGEDFAYYAERVPACFYVLGVGATDAAASAGLHSSRFTIDEDALRTGSGLMAYAAWRSCQAS